MRRVYILHLVRAYGWPPPVLSPPLAGRRKRRQALTALHRLDRQPAAAARQPGGAPGPAQKPRCIRRAGPPCRTPQAPATPADGAHGAARAPPPCIDRQHCQARHARRHGPAPFARPIRRQQQRARVRPPALHSPGSTPGPGPPHDPGAPPAAAPPPLRPVFSRKLRVRRRAAGLASPSLEGGLPLLRLFNPGQRSNAAIRSTRRAACSRSTAFPASRRATRSSKSPDTGPGKGSTRTIENLPGGHGMSCSVMLRMRMAHMPWSFRVWSRPSRPRLRGFRPAVTASRLRQGRFVAPAPPPARLCSGTLCHPPTRPQARPRASPWPDRPPAGACRPQAATACARRPAAPPPERSSTPNALAAHTPRTTPPAPPTDAAPAATAQAPQAENRIAPEPTPRPGTPPPVLPPPLACEGAPGRRMLRGRVRPPFLPLPPQRCRLLHAAEPFSARNVRARARAWPCALRGGAVRAPDCARAREANAGRTSPLRSRGPYFSRRRERRNGAAPRTPPPSTGAMIARISRNQPAIKIIFRFCERPAAAPPCAGSLPVPYWRSRSRERAGWTGGLRARRRWLRARGR